MPPSNASGTRSARHKGRDSRILCVAVTPCLQRILRVEGFRTRRWTVPHAFCYTTPMPRLRLKLPETFPFSTEIAVRVTDLNYGAHLANDAVLSLAHEARVRFLHRHGFTEGDVNGPGILMTDAAVVYSSQGFWGDTLTVEVAVADVTRCGCDLLYRLTNRATGKEVARAKTGIVFFDYRARAIVRVPEEFVARCAGGA